MCLDEDLVLRCTWAVGNERARKRALYVCVCSDVNAQCNMETADVLFCFVGMERLLLPPGWTGLYDPGHYCRNL